MSLSLQYNQYINTAIMDLGRKNGTIGLLVKIHLLSATFILSLDASPNSYYHQRISKCVSCTCAAAANSNLDMYSEWTTIMLRLCVSNPQPLTYNDSVLLLGGHFLCILNTTNTLMQHGSIWAVTRTVLDRYQTQRILAHKI